MTGSAVRWVLCSRSPRSPGQHPQPLLWYLLGTGLWQLVWGTCGSRVVQCCRQRGDTPAAQGAPCGARSPRPAATPPMGQSLGMEQEAAVPSVSFLSPPCPSCPLVRVLQPDRQWRGCMGPLELVPSHPSPPWGAGLGHPRLSPAGAAVEPLSGLLTPRDDHQLSS